MKWLCKKFGLAFNAVKDNYREFKESKGIRIPLELKKLTHLIDTIPVSIAACERGFSKMNIVLVCDHVSPPNIGYVLVNVYFIVWSTYHSGSHCYL